MNFKAWTIRKKLQALLLLTISIVLTLALLFSIVNQITTMRRSLVEKMQALAQVIGANSTAALYFEDPEAAREVLQSLNTMPHIVSGRIYRAGGEIFATYGLPEEDRVRAQTPSHYTELQNGGHLFQEGHLEVISPIRMNDEQVGSVIIRTALTDMLETLLRNILLAGVVLFSSVGILFLFLTRFQKAITGPIERLTEAMETVSSRNDFSLRIEKESEDELGYLTDGFNRMLEQLRSRDAELKKARERLEERVRERTLDLEKEVVERKRAEKELHQHTEKLKSSNQELENFAYIASHDLQDPLRKVLAFGGRLEEKYSGVLDDRGLDYLERMQNAAARMQIFIQDLLSYSRLTTRARPFESCDLNDVVQEVMADLELRLEEVQGSLKFEELPVIEAEPMQMRQLFQNLIGNALKFHREGTSPAVRITGAPAESSILEESYWKITVEDNGIGFDEKYAERIFGVFQRLHGRGQYDGTGVGLAICRKIVERHRGSITANGGSGEGAVFTVLLPENHSREMRIENGQE